MRLARLLNVCVLVGTLAACTATYRNAYDGDVRFEHCYRLDEERGVPIDQKRACWQAWTQSYGSGQPRDRIEYAMARDRALATANGAASPPAFAPTHPGSPMPTSAFASPPQTLARDAGTPGPSSAYSGRSAGELATAPGAYCGANCGKDWVDCGQGCKSASCQSGCDDRYRSCMRRCF